MKSTKTAMGKLESYIYIIHVWCLRKEAYGRKYTMAQNLYSHNEIYNISMQIVKPLAIVL